LSSAIRPKAGNAFAHGAIVSLEGVFHIRYFDTKLVVQQLDDEFWSKIEKCFLGAFNILLEVETKLLESEK